MSSKDFPKWKYHAIKEAVIVHSQESEDGLGSEWVNSPAECLSGEVILEESQVKKPVKRAKS